MVECQLPKLDVAGSTPVSRSISFLGSTPTTGANSDPELISKNITPSLGVCNFESYGIHELAD